MRALLSSLVWASCCLAAAHAEQLRLPGERDSDEYYVFPHPIKRVAVIGAGPTGLQHAATLLEHGFEVRLFERAPMPGGQWLYSDKVPVHAAFPNRPIETSAYIPDIPDTLPYTHVYTDGDEGVSNDWRIREHWMPSSSYASMKTTLPPFFMALPNVQHHPNTPWKMTIKHLQTHVRQYATSLGLNSNDFENAHVFSYSTRVERIRKLPGEQKWTLTLRKMGEVPGSKDKLQVDYWTKEFDAVVAASTVTEADAPWVPPIPGLDEWANAFPDHIIHSREYRRPEKFAGKHVLIVGGAISGSGIAADIAPVAASVSISLRNGALNSPLVRAASNLYPKNAVIVPEVESFTNQACATDGALGDARILLANGTEAIGYDYIIFASGYRMSFPFLVDFHNSTIPGLEERETRVAPIITDGTHLRSLHWTGHYISDPTLALSTVEPWDLNQYQTLAFAKVWGGKARLPSVAKMWEEYPGAGKELESFAVIGEVISRLFVTWLNIQNLEFGGPLVKPLETKDRDALEYYGLQEYGFNLLSKKGFEDREHKPRSKWPARTGVVVKTVKQPMPHWADVSDSW